MQDDIAEILIPEEEIIARVDGLSAEITAAYQARDLTVVAVLKGSCLFASDLIRRIPIPLELAFVAASSYGSGTSPGDLEIQLFPSREEIAGRDLLVVDDILDTGRTLSRVHAELAGRGARSVRTCVLLDKRERRALAFEPDFRGFEIPDLFVVGYGLDHAGRYRNLPYVASLKPELLAAAERHEGVAALGRTDSRVR
jgi:hypoxanthine phosphoribosyltransferase